MQYGQFCPIAKANEILGEKWTILIVRELLMGASRFNELQRGLGLISPALLTSRLKALEEQGLIVKHKTGAQKSFEYHPTQACKDLLPVLVAMGEWGLCWAKHNLSDADYDVEFLMLYLERSIDPEGIVGGHAVIRFEFTDLEQQKNWWIVVTDGKADLCIKEPGRETDVFLKTNVRTMAEIWMGDRSYKDAVKMGDIEVIGASALTRNINSWLKPSIFADAPRERPAA